MKVIAISGSPRKNGNTEQACLAALAPIKDAGYETELISLAGKNIQGCIACGGCGSNPKCVGHKDDFDEIYQKVKDADGLILASPVYFGYATGPICNVLHRLGYTQRRNGNFLSRRIGGAIAVARRAGANATFEQLSMFFTINDMIQVGSSYWNVGFAREPGQIQEDEEALRTLNRFGENMAWLLPRVQD